MLNAFPVNIFKLEAVLIETKACAGSPELVVRGLTHVLSLNPSAGYYMDNYSLLS